MDNGVMVARIKCQDGWIMVHQDQEEKEEEAILHCDRGHWRGKTKICKGESNDIYHLSHQPYATYI